MDDKKNIDQTFDLKKLRIDQNFEQKIGVEKKIISIPVRKPKKQEFVRIHHDDQYSIELALLVFDEDGEIYLVMPEVVPFLSEAFRARVCLTINRQGVPFLWWTKPVKQDTPNQEWNRTALVAMNIAKERWVKVVANRSVGAYEISVPISELPEPKWPDISFQEILRIAFSGKTIDSSDHIILKKLRGEQ